MSTRRAPFEGDLDAEFSAGVVTSAQPATEFDTVAVETRLAQMLHDDARSATDVQNHGIGLSRFRLDSARMALDDPIPRRSPKVALDARRINQRVLDVIKGGFEVRRWPQG